MKIKYILQKLGFSERETKVYLASVELGLSSAQDIAKKAGVKRTTGYAVLGFLVQRGVVGKTKIKGKIRFVPEPPERLSMLITELHQGIQSALPELEAIYNKTETKPKVTFYEGPNAIQNVFEDTLREKPDEILEWNTNAFFERFPAQEYINRRAKAGIHAKRLSGNKSIWERKHRHLDQVENSETVIVPKESFSPQIEVNIYNDKVAFMNYAEDLSLIIQSKAIADCMRQAYRLAWIGAKSIEIKK